MSIALSPYHRVEGLPVRNRIANFCTAGAESIRKLIERIVAVVRAFMACLKDCCRDPHRRREARAAAIVAHINNNGLQLPLDRRLRRVERRIDIRNDPQEVRAPRAAPAQLTPIAPNASWADKMRPFRNLPQDFQNAAYLQRVVDIHRAILAGADAVRPAGEREKLAEFNQNLTDPDTFLAVLAMAVRGLIFASRFPRVGDCALFLVKDYRYRPVGADPNDPEIVGSTYEDIRTIRANFERLTAEEKTFIFDHVVTGDIDTLPIPPNLRAQEVRDVLKAILDVVNRVQRVGYDNNLSQAFLALT